MDEQQDTGVEENLNSTVDDTMRETLATIDERESAPATETTQRSAEPSSAAQAPAQPVPAAPTTAPEPWRDMPKSWKAEMRAYWGKQDPQVMQYVHQREQEALRGITQYKQVSDQWVKVLSPYQQQIQQYGINPYEAVSNLVAVHTVLRHGTAEQKRAVAQILEKDYGMSQYFQPQQRGQQSMPDLSPFNNRLATVEQQLQQRALGDATSAVEKFISDPSNEFAAEAAPRMLELLEANRAEDLKEAYELAVRTDPVLFEKLISKRVEAATRAPARPPTNVRPSNTRPVTPGRANGTIEDTMRATLARINSQ